MTLNPSRRKRSCNSPAARSHILEKNASLVTGCADPTKFGLPIRHAVDQAGKGILALGMTDEDLHLVAIVR